MEEGKHQDSPYSIQICDCYPEHCMHGETCWCEPTVEIINNNTVIIHNEPN